MPSPAAPSPCTRRRVSPTWTRARSTSPTASQVANLLFRRLTQFKEDGKGGVSVVGDLATDAGKSSDGGKTWTFTLKDGIKDEKGAAITSADVRHTVERLYAKFVFDGPTYLQTWLSGADYRKALPDGGFGKKHLPASVLDTPDAKTVVFHFDTARPDLPQTLAMVSYGIVPAKTDTKEKYDKTPVATGPYKIVSNKVGKELILKKNTNWDPKTDSVRHQYADGFDFQFGVTESTQTKRLIADQGNDKNAIQLTARRRGHPDPGRHRQPCGQQAHGQGLPALRHAADVQPRPRQGPEGPSGDHLRGELQVAHRR